ncbi:MAG TPA: L,D-transpeptidase family protein [Longimicrobiales bacterium]|nr:L,D-transpeptidase family protein [Longimicrobiales bacterium]
MGLKMNGYRRAAVAITVLLVGCGRGGADDGDVAASLARLLRADSPVRLTLGDTLYVSEGVRDFYRAREQRTAWLEGEELSEQGQQVYRALAGSERDGLPAELYHFPAVLAIEARFAAADTSDAKLDDAERSVLLAELDLLLSEGMARHAQHLAQGTLDPQEAGLHWEIPREQAPEENVLEALATGRPAAEVLAALRPTSPQYTRFRQALARYREAAERGGWPQVPRDLSVAPGESSPAVVTLRQRFVQGPDSTEARLASAGAARPDMYDEQLAEAVKHFQSRHSIDADGQLGPATLRELNHTVEERMAELRLNLDRWRWLPHDLGRKHVVVNVAGFEMEVIEDGRVIENMNVVVGQQNWRTPIFADTIEYLVVNPYWNVPPSILEDEIVPALAQDPNYLERNDMERTSDGGVRQRPGPKNALGRFKFMFPNPENIYLHDTPAGHLFSRTRRDFSHGCIRLERPRDLAELMLRTATSRSPSELDAMLETHDEKWIKLDEKIPIYILYFTAWVQEDGTVRFHHDVYGRDEQLEEQRTEKLT